MPALSAALFCLASAASCHAEGASTCHSSQTCHEDLEMIQSMTISLVDADSPPLRLDEVRIDGETMAQAQINETMSGTEELESGRPKKKRKCGSWCAGLGGTAMFYMKDKQCSQIVTKATRSMTKSRQVHDCTWSQCCEGSRPTTTRPTTTTTTPFPTGRRNAIDEGVSSTPFPTGRRNAIDAGIDVSDIVAAEDAVELSLLAQMSKVLKADLAVNSLLPPLVAGEPTPQDQQWTLKGVTAATGEAWIQKVGVFFQPGNPSCCKAEPKSPTDCSKDLCKVPRVVVVIEARTGAISKAWARWGAPINDDLDYETIKTSIKDAGDLIKDAVRETPFETWGEDQAFLKKHTFLSGWMIGGFLAEVYSTFEAYPGAAFNTHGPKGWLKGWTSHAGSADIAPSFAIVMVSDASRLVGASSMDSGYHATEPVYVKVSAEDLDTLTNALVSKKCPESEAAGAAKTKSCTNVNAKLLPMTNGYTINFRKMD